MHKKSSNFNKGYTIIETMISVSLFLIIVSIAMNSLLGANVTLNKSKDMRAIMDNLTFIMEDISRNARTGSGYRCQTEAVYVDLPQSCLSGGTFSFTEAITGDRWVYRIQSTDGGLTYDLSKSIDAGATFVKLNDSSVKLKGTSGFSVLGAEPQDTGDTQQPFVIIRLVGEITYKDIVTPFTLQNSVSQRTIDINL